MRALPPVGLGIHILGLSKWKGRNSMINTTDDGRRGVCCAFAAVQSKIKLFEPASCPSTSTAYLLYCISHSTQYSFRVPRTKYFIRSEKTLRSSTLWRPVRREGCTTYFVRSYLMLVFALFKGALPRWETPTVPSSNHSTMVETDDWQAGTLEVVQDSSQGLAGRGIT